MPRLDFKSDNTTYATHGLHPYAAKCPPALVKYALRYYSRPGEVVLDPMAGSGTTIVESRLAGRVGRGFDIDPLARLIARVKCKPLDDHSIEKAYFEVRQRARLDLRLLRSATPPSAVRDRAAVPEFPNQEYWFLPTVSQELALLSYHIGGTTMPAGCRDFLWVAFSSLILAKASVANARDIIHSRHHFHEHAQVPDVLDKFDRRIGLMRKQMKDYKQACSRFKGVTTSVRTGDARNLPIDDESIDLVFTSPPYATALDYPRAHFLAVAWMQGALGVALDDYKADAHKYIGTERGSIERTSAGQLDEFDTAKLILSRLTRRSARHAALTERYFVDMHAVLNEIHRVLKTGHHAVLVICPSHIRKLTIPTHEVFGEMGNAIGLRLKRKYKRRINERLRLLPYMRGAFGRRMETEYVLIFQKAE